MADSPTCRLLLPFRTLRTACVSASELRSNPNRGPLAPSFGCDGHTMWVNSSCRGVFSCGGARVSCHSDRRGPPSKRVTCECNQEAREPCDFVATPKTAAQTLSLAFRLLKVPVSTVGASCHAVPRFWGKTRTCGVYPYSQPVSPSIAQCRVVLLRDPVERFQSAWRFGALLTTKNGTSTQERAVWDPLIRTYGGANGFVDAARRLGLGVGPLLRTHNVTLFDPRFAAGLCCRRRETPLLSPQAWWAQPEDESLPQTKAALAAAKLEAVQVRWRLEPICTPRLFQDTMRLLTRELNISATERGAWSHRVLKVLKQVRLHQTNHTDNPLSPENAEWVRSQYAHDERIFREHCTTPMAGGRGAAGSSARTGFSLRVPSLRSLVAG
jgi:hypothetical protein